MIVSVLLSQAINSVCPGVHLSLNGRARSNNSVIMISEIGSADNNILQCVTDRMPCCRTSPYTAGEWYFPGDGGVVPSFSSGATMFGRIREDDGRVNLNRVSDNVIMPTGQYCCVVPDAIGMMQWACAIVCKF